MNHYRHIKQLLNTHLIPSMTCFYLLFSCGLDSGSTNDPLHASAPYPVGVALGYRDLNNDSIRSIAGYEFNSLTAENSMKMYAILKDTTYNFDGADAYIEFAEANGMRMFGHALLWHYGLPEHVKKLEGDTAKLREFTKRYIHKVVSRYKGKVDAWDVVNEAFLDKTGAMRENIWYKTFGADYVEMAFRMAHEADPKAKLFINDYNTDRDSAKLDGLLNLVIDLKERGVPIDGIGMQMHLRMDIPNETIARHVKKAAETGLLVHFSELDIIFNRHNDDQGGGQQTHPELTEELNSLQQEKYRQIAEIYNKNVPPGQRYGITLWGFSDRNTWIRGFFNIMDWPLIFDDNLEKKPAYYGFKEGLANNQ